jgi:hypothetical protein
MSHKKLRIDKQCLNCGHEVEERFCSHCGQENLELDDSAIHLVVHYIKDLFHYDGKLWHTLKSLVTHPGLVAREYMEGKRQRHLEPVRFYAFASTVFFIMFFFVVGHDANTPPAPASNYYKRLYHLRQEKDFLKGSPDTAYINPLISSLETLSGDTTSASVDSIAREVEIDLFDVQIDTTAKMSWLEKVLAQRYNAKAEELKAQHEGDEFKATNAFLDEILHVLPQLFFLSLPFFSLFLKMLYWRARKSTYVEHFIFSLYVYAYLFAVMSLYIFLVNLINLDGTALEAATGWLILAMVLYPFIYLLLSMKRFYADRWRWLAFRYFILMCLFVATIVVLFLLLAVMAFLF